MTRTKNVLVALTLACGLVLGVLPPPAVAGSAEYGRTWRKDGVLRAGCHDYRFNYRVRPGNVQPGNDWAVEFFLIDRRGRGVASEVKDSEIDPRRGKGTFGLCPTSTVPGRFKIRGKLSVYDGWAPVEEVWIKPGRFRLRRR
ncbi:MAG: hypothetical protein ACRDO4_11525 [Nocardioides sp.]